MFIYKQPWKAHLCLNKNIQYILFLDETSSEIYIKKSLFSVKKEIKGPKFKNNKSISA